MRNQAQMLVKNQKVPTMMGHPARTMPTAICPSELLGHTSEASQENPEPQSDSWSGEEMPTVKNLDLTHVPEEHRERLQRILSKFYKMWNEHVGVVSVKSHRTNTKPGALPVTQLPYQTGTKARQFVAKNRTNVQGKHH